MTPAGGSAVASDTIYREVLKLTQHGKPVIVSMGNVAASGGYYISAPATKIVAQPSTVTGSIGVVSWVSQQNVLAWGISPTLAMTGSITSPVSRVFAKMSPLRFSCLYSATLQTRASHVTTSQNDNCIIHSFFQLRIPLDVILC